MADPTLRVKVTLDGSDVSGWVVKINDQIAKIGPAADKSVGQATARVKEHGAAWDAVGDRIGQALERIASAVGIAFTVDKLVEWISKTMEAAERVQNLSQMLGITTQTLQTFGFAAAITGTTLDNVVTSMTRLERASIEARDGNLQSAEAFRAIGVSVQDLRKLSPEELFLKTATGIGQLADGATKTTIAIQLMGRGAAESIPFFNRLGTSYEEIRQKAIALGIVLEGPQQAALVNAKESTELLGQAFKGLGNQLTIALAPAIETIANGLVRVVSSPGVHDFFKALGNDIAQMIVIGGQLLDWYDNLGKKSSETKSLVIGDVVSWVQIYLDSMAKIDHWVENYPLEVKQFWAEAWQGAENELKFHIQEILRDFADLDEKMASAFFFTSPAMSAQLASNAKGLRQFADEMTPAKSNVEQYTKAIADNDEKLKRQLSDNGAWAEATTNSADALIRTAGATEQAGKKTGDYNSQLGKTKTAADEASDALKDAGQFLDRLSASFGGPYEKAAAQYGETIDQIANIYAKLVEKGVPFEERMNFVSQATEYANQKFLEQTDVTLRLNDAVQKATDTYGRERQVLELVGRAQEVEVEYQKLANDADKALLSTMGPLTEEQQKQATGLHQLAEAQVDYRNETKQTIDVQKEWQSIVSSGLNSVADNIGQFIASGMKSWHDFWQALLSTTQQFIAQIIAQFLKLTVFNGIINSLFGLTGAAALPTGLGNGILGQLLGGSTVGGGGSGAGILSGFNLFGSGEGGILDKIGGIGGALILGSSLFSGVNAYKGAGGGAGGLAAALAYGYGTYTMGTVGAAALGGLGAGGISGAIAGGQGALMAMGPMGWIALGAMGINMITGGKLFGTGWGNTGNYAQLLDVTAQGATAGMTLNQKKEGALFSGASWREKSVAPPQAAVDAANTFFTQVQAAVDFAATVFGEQTGQVIAGHYRESYDKAGKIVTQESYVLGKKYTEDAQAFGQRLEAESILALFPVSAGVQEIAEQWRGNAADLFAGTQFLLAAQDDINKGHALVQDETLAQLTTFVQGMQAQGETLVQTYARLAIESNTMGQALKSLGIDLGKTGEDFVKFIDGMVTAAGGLDQLTQLWQGYYDFFYSDSEKQAITLDNLRQTVTDTFGQIGESTGVSMSQFRKDFQKALPNLTPSQVTLWLQAGIALGKLNAYIDQLGDSVGSTGDVISGAKKDYNAFVAQFTPGGQAMTDFTQALINVNKQTQANIDQANKLARAADMEGANVEDLTNILNVGAHAGAAALRQLEDTTQQMAATLFGSSIDQLKAQIAAYGNTAMGFFFSQPLREQLAKAQADQARAQKFGQATALMGNLGQISAITGQSLEELAKQFAIPLDQFAAMLGVNRGQMQQQFVNSTNLAKAALETADNTKVTNELLRNLLDAFMGKPLTYSMADIEAAKYGSIVASPSGKPSRPAFGLPAGSVPSVAATSATGSGDIAAAIDANTSKLDARLKDMTQRIGDNADAILKLNLTIERRGLARV